MFKQYNYMSNTEPSRFTEPPYDYDYNVLGLNKKRSFTKGELDRTDYYGYVDSGGTHQELILSEYRTYYRKDRMVYMRIQQIDWYLDDGSVGATKNTKKHYSLEESIKLGETRRRNVISQLKIETIGLIQLVSGLSQVNATMVGMAFLGEVTDEISQFIEGIEDPLKNKILTCDHHAWLDEEIPDTGGVKVREYLYNSVDLDYSDKLYIE